MQIRIFGRDPMLWVQALSAVIGIVVTLNVKGLSIDQAAAIVTALTAVGGLLAALATKPFSLGAVHTLIASLAVVVAAYGFHVPPEALGAVQLAVGPIAALLLRQAMTPAHDPLPLPSEAGSLKVSRY
jgi:hypothetical protein